MKSKLSRRTNHIAIVAAMIMTIFIGTGCKSQIQTDLPPADSDVVKILGYASLAGSSHNMQPWRTEVYPNDSLLVFADTARLLKVVDPKGIELWISVGAFIENLEIAANALGYNAEIAMNGELLNASEPVASIRLVKSGEPQKPGALEALKHRSTLRIPFKSAPIKGEDLETLVSIAPSEVIFVPADSPEGRFIAEKELEAYTFQAYQKEAQDELASWIRFSDKDVNSKLDGLSPAGMGIKGFGGYMVRNFYKPEDSKKASFVKAGVEKTREQVQNCGGWLIITSVNEGVPEWLNTGRIYERLNIQCSSLNIGFHPMNQLIEVPGIRSQVNSRLMKGRNINFAARIGYVQDYPAPVSKRRPVERFTIFR